jgi:hypothetical protein
MRVRVYACVLVCKRAYVYVRVPGTHVCVPDRVYACMLVYVYACVQADRACVYACVHVWATCGRRTAEACERRVCVGVCVCVCVHVCG